MVLKDKTKKNKISNHLEVRYNIRYYKEKHRVMISFISYKSYPTNQRVSSSLLTSSRERIEAWPKTKTHNRHQQPWLQLQHSGPKRTSCRHRSPAPEDVGNPAVSKTKRISLTFHRSHFTT